MQNVDQFVETWMGKKLGDGQCVAVANAWEENLGIPIIRGNANELMGNADPKYYQVIYGKPVPQSGDLIIFDYHPYGHVSLAISGDATRGKWFEQNDPIGSKCHTTYAPYQHMVGLIRPKGLPVTEDQYATTYYEQAGNIWRHGHPGQTPNEDSLKVDCRDAAHRRVNGETYAFNSYIDRWLAGK